MIAGTYLVSSKKGDMKCILRLEGISPMLIIANSFDLRSFTQKNGDVKQVSTANLNEIKNNINDYEFKPLYVQETMNLLEVQFEDTKLQSETRAKYNDIWETTHSKNAVILQIMKDYKLSVVQAREFAKRFDVCQW